MVISNIGSIVLSLPPSHNSQDITSPTAATANQVRILSFANTISRLIVGPLADFVSPVASFVVDGVAQFPRKHIVSRVVFLSGSCVLLIITCVWMELGVKTQVFHLISRFVLMKISFIVIIKLANNYKIKDLRT